MLDRHHDSGVRHAALDGTTAGAQLIIAYIPFALALGAALATTGLPALLSWSSSPLFFAGASQLVAVQLLDAGAGAAVIVLAVFVVNARHVLYSASMEPHMRSWPASLRMSGGFFLADPVYALAITRFETSHPHESRNERIAYYFGVSLSSWFGWMFITGAGIALGGILPESLPLHLAVPLTFLLLLLPLMKNKAGYVAAAFGGIVALATSGLPLGMNILAGAVGGIVAGGLVAERKDGTHA